MPKETKTVKLQKRFAYKYKDREHFKHILTVPEYLIDQLGWEEGAELRPLVRAGKLFFEMDSADHVGKLWRHRSSSDLRAFLLRCHKWLGGDAQEY